jgi:hypothetical protein
MTKRAATIATVIVAVVILAFAGLAAYPSLVLPYAETIARSKNMTENGMVKGARTEKRWAVLLVGGARTYAFVRDSFLREIVNSPPGHPMDVFAYTFYDNACKLHALSVDLLKEDSADFFVKESQVLIEDRVAQTIERYGQQNATFIMMQNYAERNHIKYDYVLLTRPDLLYNHMLNVTVIQQTLDALGENALLIPHCCHFGAYCDRFAIASFSGLRRMIQCYEGCMTPGFWYELAFQDRTERANMITFDLPQTYSFATLRRGLLEEACRPDRPPIGDGAYQDIVCFRKNGQQQQPRDYFPPILPAAVCHAVNASSELVCGI